MSIDTRGTHHTHHTHTHHTPTTFDAVPWPSLPPFPRQRVAVSPETPTRDHLLARRLDEEVIGH